KRQMKTLIITLSLFCLLLAAPKWHELSSEYTFDQYISDYSKNYAKGTREYDQRKIIFESKLQEILSHNQNTSHTYKRGINAFTDMSHQEFKQSKLGYSKGFRSSRNQQFRQLLLNNKKLLLNKSLNSPRALTGEIITQYLLQRIKDTVVHAGLSQLLQQLKVTPLFLPINT
ncbi:papain family cysteine protease, putative, partial [Ichthyophthirius multifiliis]